MVIISLEETMMSLYHLFMNVNNLYLLDQFPVNFHLKKDIPWELSSREKNEFPGLVVSGLMTAQLGWRDPDGGMVGILEITFSHIYPLEPLFVLLKIGIQFLF